METNLEAVVAGMIQALSVYSPKKDEPALDVDSSDDHAAVQTNEEGTQSATFEMETLKFGAKVGGRFSPSGRPLGRIVYTVAVTARWEPFEE